jgi:hypothetical protein
LLMLGKESLARRKSTTNMIGNSGNDRPKSALPLPAERPLPAVVLPVAALLLLVPAAILLVAPVMLLGLQPRSSAPEFAIGGKRARASVSVLLLLLKPRSPALKFAIRGKTRRASIAS